MYTSCPLYDDFHKATTIITQCLYMYIQSTVNPKIFVYGNFCDKNFHAENFCTLTPLQNFLYNEIFLTNKELALASSVRSTTAEEYQHQSEVRSRLPHVVRAYFPTSAQTFGLYLCTNKGVG